MSATDSKWCSICKSSKPLSEFHKDRRRRDGLQGKCKDCSRELRRRYYQEHAVEQGAKGKAWRQANQGKILHNKRLYRQRHPDRVKAQHKHWRDNNRSHVNEKSVEWVEQNREKRRAISASSAHWRRVKVGRMGAKESRGVLAYFEWVQAVSRVRCYWCKRWVAKKDRQVDHIVPLAKGGAHVVANLCCACSSCNRRKSAKMPEDFCGQGELTFGA